MIKASDQAGSAYAAMMVTVGHGVRVQYDFTVIPQASLVRCPRHPRAGCD